MERVRAATPESDKQNQPQIRRPVKTIDAKLGFYILHAHSGS